jgi:hypothetical protein
LGELIEERVDEALSFAAREYFILIGWAGAFDRTLLTITPALLGAMVVTRDLATYREEPGPHLASVFVVREPVVYDQEDLLQRVVDVATRDSKSPESAPDEACMFVKYRRKIRHRGSFVLLPQSINRPILRRRSWEGFHSVNLSHRRSRGMPIRGHIRARSVSKVDFYPNRTAGSGRWCNVERSQVLEIEPRSYDRDDRIDLDPNGPPMGGGEPNRGADDDGSPQTVG